VKIIIRQEAGTTCAWIVGEDGETLPHSESNPTDGDGTAYLKDGEQVEIDIEIAAVGTEDGQDNYPKATLGEVGPIQGGAETKPDASAPSQDQGVSEGQNVSGQVSDGQSGANATDY
jgi:hypothetical protein